MILDEKNIAGMQETIGRDGVFATEQLSQMTLASLNGALQDASYPAGGDAQNAAVLAYFTNAGLPRSQVLNVTALEVNFSVVSANQPNPAQNILDTSWNSCLSRGYLGIPIVESFAWAQLASDARSVSESVYWPDIPAETMDQVMAFQAKLADPAQREAYLSLLPVGAANGTLVIHHTSGTWQEAFAAVAAFDVTLGGTTFHYDERGGTIVLPDSGSVRTCP
jgi:hypothetical protein